MTTDRDVIIAGAGPAGVATAVALAARAPGLADPLPRQGALSARQALRRGLTGHAHAALAALGLGVRVPHVACRTGRIVYGATPATSRWAVRSTSFAGRSSTPIWSPRRAPVAIEVIEGEGLASFTVEAAGGGSRWRPPRAAR